MKNYRIFRAELPDSGLRTFLCLGGLLLISGCSQPADRGEPQSLQPQSNAATTQSETASVSLPPAEVKPVPPAPPMAPTWEQQIRKIRWICWYPSTGNPQRGIDAKPEDVERDLILLRRAGFTGLITYTTKGVQGPPLVETMTRLGYQGLIAGVWDCQNQEELKAARECAASPLTLGIVIGNEGLGKQYSLADLSQAIAEMQSATGKMVTTTEEIDDYHDEKLLQLGSWVFPNAHPYFHARQEPARAVRWTEHAYQELSQRAAPRLVWFKEVGLPTAGGDGLSEAHQCEYYTSLNTTNVMFSYFESFDLTWKNHLPIEPNWGLFRPDRQPKELGRLLLKKYGQEFLPGVPHPAELPVAAATNGGRKPMIVDGRFEADRAYSPSGLLGDTGDLVFQTVQDGTVQLRYLPRGRGPHEWEQKYVRGKLNDEAANHAGLVWLSPANDWGNSPESGYDLRELRPGQITWQARSFGRPVKARFFFGGSVWKWDQTGAPGEPPNGDSVSYQPLGLQSLTEEWQTFSWPLDPQIDWRRLVCGFGCLLAKGDHADPKSWQSEHVVEIRRIAYQRAEPPPPEPHFYIYKDADAYQNHYTPSGRIGDIGDVQINECCETDPQSGKSCIKATYHAKGLGPQACDYSGPCRFAGCYWQYPPNNWGNNKHWKGKGFDLSKYEKLTFYVRATKPCRIKFLVGGVDADYGDSIPNAVEKFVEIGTKWVPVTISLKSYNRQHIINGFGWVSNWDAGPAEFFIDELRFEQ